MSTLNRRSLLKSAAALAAGAALPAWARASEVALGDASILTLSDGEMQMPVSRLLADPDSADAQTFLAERSLAGTTHAAQLNLTLLRDGERNVLFDIGSGNNFLPGTGLLLDSMDELGVDPEEITHVVFTHAHPDHLWGLLDEFDDPLMPNAEYLISAEEWDYWTDPTTVDKLPAETQSFAAGALRYLGAIEDNITRFRGGEEILPGVAAVATHGHSPGHTAFEIRRSSESVMVCGDALTHEHISFARPDWYTGSDQDKAMGAAARVALLDRLHSDKMQLVGYHLPGGGLGRVEKDGNKSYRFVAADA